MPEEKCPCGMHKDIDTSKPVKLFSGFKKALEDEGGLNATFKEASVNWLGKNETFMVEKSGEDTYLNKESGTEFNGFELEQA